MKTIQRFALTLLSILIILSATACAPDDLSAFTKKDTPTSSPEENQEDSISKEADESLKETEEPKAQEEQKLSIAEINARLKEQQADRVSKGQSRLSQKTREGVQMAREKKLKLRRTLKALDASIKKKSLGKLYPKHSLTWKGITLSYLPYQKSLELIAKYDEMNANTFDAGYILETNSAFKRNDGKSTSYGAHNADPGFAPFNQMQIGDHVFVTGSKGTTFDYIVIDNIEFHHKGIHDLTPTGDVKMIKKESANENFLKLTGSHCPDPESFDFLEYISLSWCRDDYIMECFVAVPIEHYHFYVEEGIIDPVD